jgi:hypothetical protein
LWSWMAAQISCSAAVLVPGAAGAGGCMAILVEALFFSGGLVCCAVDVSSRCAVWPPRTEGLSCPCPGVKPGWIGLSGSLGAGLEFFVALGPTFPSEFFSAPVLILAGVEVRECVWLLGLRPPPFRLDISPLLEKIHR